MIIRRWECSESIPRVGAIRRFLALVATIIGCFLFLPLGLSAQSHPDVSFVFQKKLVPLNDIATKETLGAKEGTATVLLFWASWCDYCRDQMHRFRPYYEANRERGLRIVAISLEKEEEAARKEVTRMKYPFPTYHADGDSIQKQLDIKKLPTTYILDKSGRVVSVYRGMSSERFSYMRKRLNSMLGQAED